MRLLWQFEWYRRLRGGRWYQFYGENPSQGPFWVPCKLDERASDAQHLAEVPPGAHAISIVNYTGFWTPV